MLALQVMCLVMASCLKRTKWRPAEDEDSDDEWEAQYARRKQRKEPLLPKDKTPVSEKNEAWSARMREKYGLDTAQFAYTVEEDTEEEPAKRSCAIMQAQAQSRRGLFWAPHPAQRPVMAQVLERLTAPTGVHRARQGGEGGRGTPRTQ